MIHFHCKWCRKRFRAPDDCGGRAGNCSRCQRPVWVPVQYLHFVCNGCGKKYRTSVQFAGVTQDCRKCGARVTAPPLETKEKPFFKLPKETRAAPPTPAPTAPSDIDLELDLDVDLASDLDVDLLDDLYSAAKESGDLGPLPDSDPSKPK